MASHTTTTVNENRTVDSPIIKTDGTTTQGTIRTTVSSSGAGAYTRVRLVTSDGAFADEDDAACTELLEFCDDMLAHWTEVKAAVQAVASALAERD